MKSPLIWLAAVSLIGLLGAGPALCDQDAKKLEDKLYAAKDVASRITAAVGLVNKYPDVVTKILEDQKTDRKVLEALLESLVPSDSKADFFEPLFELYKRLHADTHIRHKVIKALARRDAKAVGKKLIGMVSANIQPDDSRRAAIRALGEMRAFRQMNALLSVYQQHKAKLGKPILNALSEMTRLDYGANVQAWQNLWLAIKGKSDLQALEIFLDRLRNQRIKDLENYTKEIIRLLEPKNLKQLLMALQSPLPGVRSYAARNLTVIGGKAVADAFLKALQQEKHTAVMLELISGIGKLGPAQAGPLLLKIAERVRTANNPHPYALAEQRLLYAGLAHALGQLSHGKAVAQIQRWLTWTEADTSLKLACIGALGAIGNKGPAYPPLAQILTTNKQTKLLQASAEALGSFPQAATILIGALPHPQTNVRAAVAGSLEKIGPKLKPEAQKVAAAALIKQKLAEKESRVRNLLIVALGKYPGTHLALIKSLVDTDSLCKLSSTEALVKQGLHQETIVAFEKALEDKDIKDAAFKGLRTLLANKRAKRAELAQKWFAANTHHRYCLTLSEALRKNEKDAKEKLKIERRIARCHLRLGQLAQARPLYETLIQNSKDPLLYLELATLLGSSKKLEDLQKALATLKDLKKIVPKMDPKLQTDVTQLEKALDAKLKKHPKQGTPPGKKPAGSSKGAENKQGK